MGVSLTITRKGGTSLREGIEELTKGGDFKGVKVGVLKGTGLHPNSKTATVAQVAWWNEFGTSRIPERSFLRSTMREEQGKYAKLLRGSIVRILKGKLTTDKALKALGQKAKSDIQAKIRAIREPANAASTIARKGSSNPLIDEGMRGGLLGSIQYALLKRGE